jgi:ribonuclease BN (tRNA processing enzyme)
MVDTGTSKILLDTGPGSLRQLLKAGTNIKDIDYIMYSHFHIDHIADMLPFIFASKYSTENTRTKDLMILGPTGLKTLYGYFKKAHGKWVVPEHFNIDWIEVGKDPIQFPSFFMQAAPTKHTENSMAIRIEDQSNKSIVYSGDTEYCSNLIMLAQKTNLLILECAFPEHMKNIGHLVPSIAGRIATESQCNKLLLTHFYPACEGQDLLTPLRSEYSGEAILAEDFMKLSI